MKTNLLRVLVGLLFVAFGAWLYSATEWVDKPLPPVPDEAVRKDRLFAAKAMLRQLGAQVEERQSLDAMPPAAATLLLTSVHWRLFPARVQALRRFVEAGGHLVIPWTLASNEAELAWLGIESQEVPASERKSLAESQRKQRGKNQGKSEGKSGREHEDDDDEPCIARQDAPGVRPAFTPTRELLLCTEGYRWNRLRPKGAPQWVLTGPSGAEVVRVPVGRGRVTMTLAEDLHDNDALLKGDHALLLAATLDLARGDIVWFIATETRPPLATLLRQHGLTALLVGALALALALWRSGTRFGPRQAVPLPARRSMREQIAGTAAFIAARGGAPLHRAQLRALERSASQHLPGFDRLIAARERAEAIAHATATDPVALAQAMDGTPKRPPRALAAALALLETARRRLLPPARTNHSANPKAHR